MTIIVAKMRAMIFFGLFAHLLEYVTIRIYHEFTDEDCYCTINILDMKTNQESRWTLSHRVEKVLLFLEILTIKIPSIVADVLNNVFISREKNKFPTNDLDIIIGICEAEFQDLDQFKNDYANFVYDCKKMLNLLKMLENEMVYGRVLECQVIIGEILILVEKMFFLMIQHFL